MSSKTISRAIILPLIALSFLGSAHLLKPKAYESDLTSPPLYLPETRYVKPLTLGFQNFGANLLWFQTMDYFGKQLRGKRDYRWLAHMCKLVTELNSRSRTQFEFCGNLVSWAGKDPEASNEILDRAAIAHPDYWRFPYMRGFNNWYFLEDKRRAKDDMIRASKRPEAPLFLASLASRLITDTENPALAIEFLTRTLERTNNPSAKLEIEEKLKLARLSQFTKKLEGLVVEYQEIHGEPAESLDDLVEAKMLKFVPKDPFGGEFYLKDGQVENTSGKKGLKFHGKTAQTGIFANEFKSQ